MIALKQCDGGTVYPKDDAILNDLLLGQNGVIHGCEVTQVAGSTLRIAAGYGIIKGRMFEVTETDVICALPGSGETTGELYIIMDFSSSPYIRFETRLKNQQFLEKNENINYDETGAYSIVITSYVANSSGVTSVGEVKRRVRERIKIFENKTVSKGSWEQAYGKTNNIVATRKYQYQACITLPDIDDYYIPNVYFCANDVELGIYSPLAKIQGDGLYIAAKKIPDNNTLIEVIECVRKGGD